MVEVENSKTVDKNQLNEELVCFLCGHSASLHCLSWPWTCDPSTSTSSAGGTAGPHQHSSQKLISFFKHNKIDTSLAISSIDNKTEILLYPQINQKDNGRELQITLQMQVWWLR